MRDFPSCPVHIYPPPSRGQFPIAIQLAGNIRGGVLEKRLISKKRKFQAESRRIYTPICGGAGGIKHIDVKTV